MKAASLLLGLLLGLPSLAGCGARTDAQVGVEGGDGAVPGRDGGSPMRDARPPRRRDAGPPRVDAGPPPECGELVPLTDRFVVHEDAAGMLGAPQVVFREGGFDLVATFSAVDDDRINDVRARRLAVGRSGDVSLSDVSTLEEAPLSSASAATLGGELGVLSGFATGDPEPEVRLLTYGGPGYPLVREAPIWEGRAMDVAAGGERWMVAFGWPGGDGPRVMTLDRFGMVVSMPLPAVDPALPGHGDARLRATATDDGFAWVSSPLDPEGLVAVGFLRGFEIDWTLLPGARPVVGETRPLGIARSPWSPGSVLVAGYDYGSLFVSEVERGGELWRGEGLAFSMVGDVTPALVAGRRFGAVVAGMHFGDADPTGGVLEVLLLGPGGEPRGPSFAFEARRSGSFGEAGIDAATDGELVVLHFTHFDAPTGSSQTRALVLACE